MGHTETDDALRPPRSPPSISRSRSPTPSPNYFNSSSATPRASLAPGPGLAPSASARDRSPARASESGAAPAPSSSSAAGPNAVVGAALAAAAHVNVQSPVTASVAEHYSFGGRADSEEPDSTATPALFAEQPPRSELSKVDSKEEEGAIDESSEGEAVQEKAEVKAAASPALEAAAEQVDENMEEPGETVSASPSAVEAAATTVAPPVPDDEKIQKAGEALSASPPAAEAATSTAPLSASEAVPVIETPREAKAEPVADALSEPKAEEAMEIDDVAVQPAPVSSSGAEVKIVDPMAEEAPRSETRPESPVAAEPTAPAPAVEENEAAFEAEREEDEVMREASPGNPELKTEEAPQPAESAEAPQPVEAQQDADVRMSTDFVEQPQLADESAKLADSNAEASVLEAAVPQEQEATAVDENAAEKAAPGTVAKDQPKPDPSASNRRSPLPENQTAPIQKTPSPPPVPTPPVAQSPSPSTRVPEPVSPLFGLAEAALGLLQEADPSTTAAPKTAATAPTAVEPEMPMSTASKHPQDQGPPTQEAAEMAALAVARTEGAASVIAPAPVRDEETTQIEVPSLGITLTAQEPSKAADSSIDTSLSQAVIIGDSTEATDKDVDVVPPSGTPPPIVLELTEEEREQNMRSALVRLGREFQTWQADEEDLLQRNRRMAKQQRARGHLPAGVPALPDSRQRVDVWLMETDDPVRKAEQEQYFAQVREDVQKHVIKEQAALQVKAERLKKEYLSIDRSWQQHCNRLQRLEERRDPRDVLPGSSALYNSLQVGQSQLMQPNLSSLQRRPAMHLSMSSGPLSGGGLNNLSSSALLPDDYVTTPMSARGNRRGGASAFPGFGDAVRSEAEFLEILASLENADMQDPNARAARTTATVPDLTLTADGEPMLSNYDDDNGFVANPEAFYFDEFDPDVWTEEEKATFERKYALWPKQFGRIAAGIPGKTRAQCVRYYYLNKKQPGSNFKAIAAARSRERKRKNRVKPKKAKGSALMADLKMDDVGDDDDPSESRGDLVDSDMVDASTAEGQGGSSDLVAPMSPPAKKRRKDELSAADGLKKSKTKGRKTKGEKKSKTSKLSPTNSSDPVLPPPVVRTPLVANPPPLASIGEHEESELAAAEMLNALAGIVPSPQTNSSQPLPTGDDNKPAKKKRKTIKGEGVLPDTSSSSDPVIPSASGAKRARQSTSSYWSIDEKNEFLRSLAANGKEWNLVASTLQTKSAAQARNYYMRNADDPDFIEAIKIGEHNSKLDPSAREAAATAFHNRRIADGAPVGIGTGRVQPPPPTPAASAPDAEESAPAAHRGFQIMSLLNEQPSRPDSRSSSAPFSSQAGRDELGEALDGPASSRRGAPSTDEDVTDEEEYAAPQAAPHQGYPLHPPIHDAAYHRPEGYSYAPRPTVSAAQSPLAAPSAFGAPPAPTARAPVAVYSYAPAASGERSSVPARDAMPPPSIARRYEGHSPVIVSSAHGGHQHMDDGERSDYGRGSTPHGATSPDMERHQPVYPEPQRPAHPPWLASNPAVPTGQARSSSVRYAPAPLPRGYPIQAPSQSPPPRALHSASPVAALSTSAPSAHSSMQPPLSRPAYVAYRSTSASVAPSYSTGQHGHHGEHAESAHAHGHSISRMMSQSPEQHVVPAHRASQSPAYPPLGLPHGHGHAAHSAHHQIHAPVPQSHAQALSHPHGSALQHPSYSSPSPGGYATASVRSSAIPRGPTPSLSVPPRPSTSSSSSSAGTAPSSTPAYALSASRGGGGGPPTLPSLPSIHSLNAPSRLLSSSRTSTATSLESPYGQLSHGGGGSGAGAAHSQQQQQQQQQHSPQLPLPHSSHGYGSSHLHSHSHSHPHSHSHTHSYPQHHSPHTLAHPHASHPHPHPHSHSHSHMQPPPPMHDLRRSMSPGGMAPPATSGHSGVHGHGHGSSDGRHTLHPPPLPLPHSHAHSHSHAYGHAQHGHVAQAQAQGAHAHSLVHPRPQRAHLGSSSSSGSSSPRASPIPGHPRR
ncbi:DNA-binding protein snt1 [Tilletia horrida]|nr:DNA-binding protein snt1 [Tilletia horrida]